MSKAARSCVAGALGLLAACATAPVVEVAPGERPALDSDEAGLWMGFDRMEESLRSSGKVIHDPALQAYVEGVLCRLAADHCADIRVYIVTSPGLNAAMAANGTMIVWSGFLLRANNEAQVATVLGHELAHYLRRHSLKRWRDLRAKTDALIFFRIATAVAGIGLVGDVATIATYGSIFAFNRDHEREADDYGFDLMAAAGYEPREAAKIWILTQREKEASEDPVRVDPFFATHPPSQEREQSLRSKAEGLPNGELGEDRHQSTIAPFRGDWLSDEIRANDPGRTKFLLDQLLAEGVRPGEIHFYRGEFFRHRAEDGDEARAIVAYEAALRADSPPNEAHRALGLLYWSKGDKEKARQSLEAYLAGDPAAGDRAMIESYVKQLSGEI